MKSNEPLFCLFVLCFNVGQKLFQALCLCSGFLKVKGKTWPGHND